MKKIMIILLMMPIITLAHPGGTNSNGCHKQDGVEHCHKKQPIEKRKVIKDVLELNYDGFTVWVDCEKHGAIKFRYNVKKDMANFKRHSKFYIDPSTPKSCQQISTKAYGKNYDRGHMVPANHLDNSKLGIKQTNYMTNILPQHKNLNRGAWLKAEMITECYRDIEDLLVIGGVIWGNNPDDDYFVDSHDVKTPDAFWKVIIRGGINDERVIAWIMPNSAEAKRDKLDDYLVSINKLEKIVGKLPVADYNRTNKVPQYSWQIPKGCDKS